MINKILSKEFLYLSNSNDKRYLVGESGRSTLLYDIKQKRFVKKFKITATGVFNDTDNKLLLSEMHGKFSIYDFTDDTIISKELPSKYKETPMSPCCFFKDNAYFTPNDGLQKRNEFFKYNLQSDSFELLENSKHPIKIMGKLDDFIAVFLSKSDKGHFLTLRDGQGQICALNELSFDSNIYIFKNRIYVIESKTDCLYEYDKQLNKKVVFQFEKQDWDYITYFCVNEKFIALITNTFGKRDKMVYVIDFATHKVILKQKFEYLMQSLLLVDDILFVGTMKDLYRCDLLD